MLHFAWNSAQGKVGSNDKAANRGGGLLVRRPRINAPPWYHANHVIYLGGGQRRLGFPPHTRFGTYGGGHHCFFLQPRISPHSERGA
jgi:hypothetical protein